MARINSLALILLVMITAMYGRVQVKAFRADMQRAWGRSMTNHERLRHAVHRSNARLKRLQSAIRGEVAAAGDAGAPVKRGDGEFLMTMGVGTPPRKMIGIVDTGSDLIWTQCQPCTTCFSQPDHIFDPAKSSTYSKVSCSSPLCSALRTQTCTPDCEYSYFYGDGSDTHGVLSNDTFSMWKSSGMQQSIPGVVFGCSHVTPGDGFSEEDGLVGLGRGSLSFISQIGSTVGSKFSYCLTSDADKSTSPLFFGSAAGLKGDNIKSTPMLKNSACPELNTYYYISVTGISVGTTLADIPDGSLDIRKDGIGGFIIDSGTTFTYLSPKAFNAVAQALSSTVGWKEADGFDHGFDLCYSVLFGATPTSLPDIAFHLGGDADYIVEGKPSFGMVAPDSGLLCFLMLKTPASKSRVPSILGNYQQKNIHILYDNDNEKVSFKPASCGELSHRNFDEHFIVSGSPTSTLGLLSLIVFFLFPLIISALSY